MTLIRGARAIHAPDQPDATDLRFAGGRITELGRNLATAPGEDVVDAAGCVLYPGLVNTHHHLAQSVLKGVPAGLNQGLGEWLASVPYRFWPHITPELMYDAARLGLVELLRSGATTCADHHYLYHADTSAELEDVVWQAADDLGVRLVLCRGGATHAGSHKGLAGGRVQPESLDRMLGRLDASRRRYHQDGPDVRRKLVVAPTSLVHTSPPEDLRELARYARQHGLRLHSHLLEVGFDETQSQARHGLAAIDYAEACDWLGPDVWFAHLVQSDTHAIARLAATGTGVAHCPTSNARLGSGIAPAVAMHRAGVPVSLAVDGSAAAESGSMLQELNLAWLIHRARLGPEATDPAGVLDWATRGGAGLLGLDAIGELKVGMAADLALYDLESPRFAGMHDPRWAPLIAGEPIRVRHAFVQGRPVVGDGRVANLDEAELAERVRRGVAELIKRAT